MSILSVTIVPMDAVEVVVSGSASITMMTHGFLSSHYDVIPTVLATISGGEVLTYIWNGVTRYRFIPDPYDPPQDAYYSNWDGSAVSGLIAAKGVA